jgi:IS30 family transposase
MRVDDKSARSITATTIEQLNYFKEAMFAITGNNGEELTHHEMMTV